MAKQTFTTGQVLTAAQMTSLQQTAMGGGSTTDKTTSYVLTAADAGTVVQMNAAGATTITVNTALFAAGDTVQIQNIGAGVCTITAGTATVNTAGSLALSQWEGGHLYFTATGASVFFDTVQSGGGAAAFAGCVLTQSNSTQSVATNTLTSVTFNTEQIDTDGYHSTGSNTDRITIPSTKVGKYMVTGSIAMSANTTGARVVKLSKNGSVIYETQFPATSTGVSFGIISFVVDCASADYLTLGMFHTGGVNLNVAGTDTAGTGATSFQATYLGA
jgi:hypothetical protein